MSSRHSRHVEDGEIADSSDEDSRRSDRRHRRSSRSRSPYSRRSRDYGSQSGSSRHRSSGGGSSHSSSSSSSSRSYAASSSSSASSSSASSRHSYSSGSSGSSRREADSRSSRGRYEESRHRGADRDRDGTQADRGPPLGGSGSPNGATGRDSAKGKASRGGAAQEADEDDPSEDDDDSDDQRAQDRLAAELRAREERRLQRERRLRELAQLSQQSSASVPAGTPAAAVSSSGSPSSANPTPAEPIRVSSGAPGSDGRPQESPETTADSKGETGDDDFDMFSASPGQVMRNLKLGQPNDLAADGRAVDNFQDHEGYYVFRAGDVIAGRYQVYAMQGKGVFSTVLRVRDLKAPERDRDVVVKVMRNNDTMRRAGEKELEFLRVLAEKDPEGRKHCVRMLEYFDHEGHMCVVFEPLHMNLREVLRKFGGIGLHISAVQSYARQLLIALQHLKNCRIVHGDIKPDNILVNEAMNVAKLCDFGSAGWVDKCEITPYLVSRFYRPPEVIIGAPYDCQVDIWSIGCVLFELFTGKILFRGADNNSVLQAMLELKGQMSKRMVRRGMVHALHFDENGAFLSRRLDPITQQVLVKPVVYDKPAHQLLDMLLRAAEGSTAEDRRKVSQLADLLDKMLMLDPNHRITIEKALQHPFLQP